MSNILSRIILILLMMLFFLLPIVNSSLGEYLGLSYDAVKVHGTFEFTKAMFFNVYMGVISVLFFIFWAFNILNNKSPKHNKEEGRNILIKKEKRVFKYLYLSNKSIIYIAVVILLLIVSNFNSISFYTSLFGSSDKGHGTILFLNLIILTILIKNLKKSSIKPIMMSFILGTFMVAVISIKEYFIPSVGFDYSSVGDRAVGTMGHPNYLVLTLLLSLVLIYHKLKFFLENEDWINYLLYFFIIVIVAAILLSKSFFGIFLLIVFNIYQLRTKATYYSHRKIINWLLVISLISVIGTLSYLFPEKIHSFISRYYIRISTIDIIFSDYKLIVFGGGLDTLKDVFINFKSSYLYIFENIGFTADRPHNIFLNIWYHLGLFGLILILHFVLFVRKNFVNLKENISKNISFAEGIIIFLIFTSLNFSSIASYIVLILMIAVLLKNAEKREEVYYTVSNKAIGSILLLIITICSCIGAHYSYSYYLSETKTYNKEFKEAIKIFPYNKLNYYYSFQKELGSELERNKSELYYLSQLYSGENIKNSCDELLVHFSSVENYFYCGNIFESVSDKEQSIKYYNMGLEKLPDLWNKDSKYYNNLIIKYTIDGNRFFDEKYSDVGQILEKVK